MVHELQQTFDDTGDGLIAVERDSSDGADGFPRDGGVHVRDVLGEFRHDVVRVADVRDGGEHLDLETFHRGGIAGAAKERFEIGGEERGARVTRRCRCAHTAYAGSALPAAANVRSGALRRSNTC